MSLKNDDIIAVVADLDVTLNASHDSADIVQKIIDLDTQRNISFNSSCKYQDCNVDKVDREKFLME